jgi:hypothetical protein
LLCLSIYKSSTYSLRLFVQFASLDPYQAHIIFTESIVRSSPCGQDFLAIFRALRMSLAPLASVSSSSSFVYDGDGRPVKSVLTTNLGTSITIFVGARYEITNGVVTKYYFTGAQRIATLAPHCVWCSAGVRTDGTLSYLIGDHLGSTSIVADAAGNVLSQQKYKVWGRLGMPPEAG